MSTNKKKHHYVAQGYLAGFCTDGRLWVRDCEIGQNRHQRKEKVAAINHYYSEECDGKVDQRMEDELAKMEELALPIIAEVDRGGEITSRSKAILSIFVAIQWLRVPDYQRKIEKPMVDEAWRQLPNTIRDYLRELVKTDGPLDIYPEDWSRTLTLENVEIFVERGFHLRMIKHKTAKTANFLAGLNWAIIHTDGNSQFVTSDNPVVLLENGFWLRRTKLDILSLRCSKFIPLTHRSALLMGGKGSISRHETAPVEVVDDFNRSVARNVHRFIFARNFEYIAKVATLADDAKRRKDESFKEN